MGKKNLGVILLVVGVLLFLVSLAADSLGLGSNPGLGYKQIAGIVIGIVIAAAGMVTFRAKD